MLSVLTAVAPLQLQAIEFEKMTILRHKNAKGETCSFSVALNVARSNLQKVKGIFVGDIPMFQANETGPQFGWTYTGEIQVVVDIFYVDAK